MPERTVRIRLRASASRLGVAAQGILRGLAVAGILAAMAAGPAPPGTDPVEYEKAARTILCDCGCHPQSVYDCACGRAAEMREEIAALIREGRTGDEVIAAYVAEQGEQIRIAPTAAGFNLVAWLGPAVLFVVAAGSLMLLLKRWARQARERTQAVSVPQIDVDDPYLARLEKDLEKYE